MSTIPQHADHHPASKAAFRDATGEGAARSPRLGELALVLAIVTIAVFRVVGHLVSLWAPGIVVGSSSGRPDLLEWAEAGCMATALLLGIVAVVTGRGRLYGSAASVLAILGTGFVIQALVALSSGPVVVHDVH